MISKFHNSDRELPPGAQDGQASASSHASDVGRLHADRFPSNEFNISAFLRMPPCIAPLYKEGHRATIEGVRHHFTDETGQSKVELFRLWVTVRDRKGLQLGRYEISPAISQPLGAELGKYLCPPSSEAKEGIGNPSRQESKQQVDQLLAGLVKVVSAFEGYTWVAIPDAKAELRTAGGVSSAGSNSSLDSQDLPLEQQLERLRKEVESGNESLLLPPRRTIYMKPKLPEKFQEVAEKPELALDRQWISAIEKDGRYTTVEATILTGRLNRVRFDVTVQDENNQQIAEESFSVSIPSRSGNEMTAHLALESLIAEAMYDFLQRGLNAMRETLSEEYFKGQPAMQRNERPDAARQELKNAHNDPDDRLQRGDLLAGRTVFEEILPSGAQVRINVGKTAALLTISANESPNSSSRSWLISDPKISSPSSSAHRDLFVQARMLCAGDILQRCSGLEALNSLAAKSGERALFGKCGSLDEAIGQSLEFDLASLKNISFDSIAAASQDQILDLLKGVQLMQVALSRAPSSSRGLTRFNRVLFGIYPDGSLSVRATNPLSGLISAKLTARTCNEFATEFEPDGYREVIGVIARTLNGQELGEFSAEQEHWPPGDREALLKLLESLANRDKDFNTIDAPFGQTGRRIPPSYRTLANEAYDKAGKYARIWAAASGGHVSEASIEWVEGSDSCLMTIPFVGPNNDSITLTSSHRGVHKFVGQFSFGDASRRKSRLVLDLQSPGQELAESPRLRLLELREIFDRAIYLAESGPKSWKDVSDSSLARFLQLLKKKKGLGDADQE